MFELDSLLPVAERNGSLYPPRNKLRGVRHATRIMSFQPGSQVFSKSNVEPFAVHLRLKNVNVVKHGCFQWLAEPKPARESFIGPPSSSATLRAKAGARGRN